MRRRRDDAWVVVLVLFLHCCAIAAGIGVGFGLFVLVYRVNQTLGYIVAAFVVTVLYALPKLFLAGGNLPAAFAVRLLYTSTLTTALIAGFVHYHHAWWWGLLGGILLGVLSLFSDEAPGNEMIFPGR